MKVRMFAIAMIAVAALIVMTHAPQDTGSPPGYAVTLDLATTAADAVALSAMPTALVAPVNDYKVNLLALNLLENVADADRMQLISETPSSLRSNYSASHTRAPRLNYLRC